MDLCLTAEMRPGSQVAKQWWDQVIFYLEGMQVADQDT